MKRIITKHEQDKAERLLDGSAAQNLSMNHVLSCEPIVAVHMPIANRAHRTRRSPLLRHFHQPAVEATSCKPIEC